MNRTLALLAVLVISTCAAAPAATTVTHITVNGEGTVAVVPDQASIRATVITNADRAEDAVSQNNAIYTRIVAATQAQGIARSDVTLADYNLNFNPRPSPEPGQRIIPSAERYGYVVTRSFDIVVRSIAKAGAVVDAITKAGVTNVDGISFGSSDPSRVRGEATAKAMADARSKAEEAAKAAGLHITGIDRIAFGGSAPVVPMMRMSVMSAAPAPTTFDAGAVKVTTELTVIFLASP
ncbi:MAG TPA: SIMPL domain-containing protein [Alphaproteobacteria bacterium]|nr:SIMPL domain-containing protein [Alphaproteobacteria bacterium]